MAEEYRVELIHKWRMKRLNEAIEAVRRARIILEQDIACIRQQNQEKNAQ